MKIKTAIASLILLLGCLHANAQTDTTVNRIIEANHRAIEAKTVQTPLYSHEIRLGIGDGFYDKVAFPDTPHRPYASALGDSAFEEEQNHRYLPHLFAQYTWSPSKSRFGFGAGIDFFAFDWDDVTYRGGSDNPVSSEHQNCFNIALMAGIRYRWNKQSDRWLIYSALQAGVDINTGSETDMYGKRTELGFAFAPTLLGVSYGFGNYFAAVDFGAHFAVKDAMNLYSAFSKIVSISAGYRF